MTSSGMAQRSYLLMRMI